MRELEKIKRCMHYALTYIYKYSMLSYNRNSEVGSMGVGAVFCMYDVVVKKFTFAISSPDEFLLPLRPKSIMLPGPKPVR